MVADTAHVDPANFAGTQYSFPYADIRNVSRARNAICPCWILTNNRCGPRVQGRDFRDGFRIHFGTIKIGPRVPRSITCQRNMVPVAIQEIGTGADIIESGLTRSIPVECPTPVATILEESVTWIVAGIRYVANY